MSRYTPPSRRTFLKLVGTAGAASLFGKLLWPQVAEAAEPSPLRYLSLLSYHGKVPERWLPQGTADAPELAFAGSTLAPLAPHLAKLLVVSGLDYQVLYDQPGAPTGHAGGQACAFTGSRVANGKTESPSLDVFLADALGGSTAIRSIQLVNHIQFCSDESPLSFSQSGERLPLIAAPLDVYNRLFAGFTPGAPPSPTVDPKVAGRRSLVAFWLADANRLRAKLAAPEQHKLDAHLSALHDIERRLADQPASPTPATCALPAQPRSYSLGELSGCSGQTGERLIPERTKLIFDILVQAFACDRTRFGAISLWPGLVGAFGNFVADFATQNIHDSLAHQLDNGAEARNHLADLHTWYAQMIRYLLDGLAAVSENGGTLLDHSLMLWGNELSNPSAHSNRDMPYVLLGGANGRLRPGRSLAFPSGTPHNRLLASVAQAFGQPVSGFGNPGYAGTLSGLT